MCQCGHVDMWKTVWYTRAMKNLRDHIEDYLNWKASYTTRAYLNYRPWLVQFAEYIKDKPVEQITLDDIVKYRKHLGSRYKPYSIQLAMVTVHNFFVFCNIQRIESLPAGLIRVPRVIPTIRPYVSEEDYEKIKSSSSGDDFISIRNTVIMRLLWDTGMRVSELCDMNLADISVDKREAIVRTRKSNEQEQVFWSDETDVVLRSYMKKREVVSSSPALFIGVNFRGTTKRLHVRSIQRIVDLAGEKIGKKITPHSFRHGKAHKILHRGGGIKEVSSVLRHSETNPAAAMHYLRLDNKERRFYAKKYLK